MITAASETKRTTRNVSHFKKCNPAAYTRTEEPEWDMVRSSREAEDQEEPQPAVNRREPREGRPSRRPQRTNRRPVRLIEEL